MINGQLVLYSVIRVRSQLLTHVIVNEWFIRFAVVVPVLLPSRWNDTRDLPSC